MADASPDAGSGQRNARLRDRSPRASRPDRVFEGELEEIDEDESEGHLLSALGLRLFEAVHKLC